MTKKELFRDCFYGGDWLFYLLFPITFIFAFLFFLILSIGGVEEIKENEEL